MTMIPAGRTRCYICKSNIEDPGHSGMLAFTDHLPGIERDPFELSPFLRTQIPYCCSFHFDVSNVTEAKSIQTNSFLISSQVSLESFDIQPGFCSARLQPYGHTAHDVGSFRLIRHPDQTLSTRKRSTSSRRKRFASMPERLAFKAEVRRLLDARLGHRC
jgi:hypothetical protein